MHRPTRKDELARGFTLIELLVVVAILAILAAIALYNLLDAQTRSKIAAVHSNLRTLATALECYAADTNHYPIGRAGTDGRVRDSSDAVRSNLADLTTPVAYLTVLPWQDPFLQGADSLRSSLVYCSYDGLWGAAPAVRDRLEFAFGGPVKGWALVSAGPDRKRDGAESYPIDVCIEGAGSAANWSWYDATNGTRSNGDLARWGGAMEMPGP